MTSCQRQVALPRIRHQNQWAAVVRRQAQRSPAGSLLGHRKARCPPKNMQKPTRFFKSWPRGGTHSRDLFRAYISALNYLWIDDEWSCINICSWSKKTLLDPKPWTLMRSQIYKSSCMKIKWDATRTKMIILRMCKMYNVIWSVAQKMKVLLEFTMQYLNLRHINFSKSNDFMEWWFFSSRHYLLVNYLVVNFWYAKLLMKRILEQGENV